MPTYVTSTVAAPMPNLENLKKQAKLVLRWHRDRYYPVAAQIRSGLPRYSQMTDSEILAQSFKLGDAQELVARQHGFESWQALKTGLPTMSDHAGRFPIKPSSPPPSRNCSSPISEHRAISSRASSASALRSAMASRRSMRRSSAMARGLICGASSSRPSMPA